MKPRGFISSFLRLLHPPAQLAVGREIEDLAGRGIVLQQAQAPGDFLVGFFLAAQVTPETVLVEFLAGNHVPQPAAVGADFVSQYHPRIITVPNAPELELEVDQADVD